MNSFQRDAVARRMKYRGSERFEAVDQGVRAGGGGQFGRQPAGQFRVQNDQAGEEGGMKDDLFASLLDDDGTAADFAAGAGGGRDGDTGREAAPIGRKVKWEERLAGPFEAETNDLADIERAAAAEGDHGITFALLIGGGGGFDVFHGGIGMNAGKNPPLFPGNPLQGFKSIGGNQSGIGNNQRIVHAERVEMSWQFLQAAGAESDIRREGEICCHFVKS